MMPSTYIKSLVCVSLTTEDWNTLHEIVEDSGDSIADTISAMVQMVLERLQEETEYIDSIGGRAEGDESSPKQYDTPSLFL